MVRRHGRRGRIWISGYRLTPDVVSYDESHMLDAPQITSMEEDDHTYVPGVRGGNMRMTAIFNEDAGRIDEIMGDIVELGTESNPILVVRDVQQGAPGWGAAGGFLSNYAINGPSGGPVAVTAEMVFSEKNNRTLNATSYGTVSAAGTVSASTDMGAGSAPNGVDIFAQWDSILGTVQAIVYSGATNLAQTTARATVLMTAAGGVGGTAFARITTPVQRYITTVWSLPGGTGTAAFVVAVGRVPG